MRLLIEHSGYGLRNIGDIAMFQACALRLGRIWPDAEIEVFTESPDRLEMFCPGATAVAPTVLGRGPAQRIPLSAQLAGEQFWKIAAPRLDRRQKPKCNDAPVRQQQAILRADAVISSGGGFVNDVFWWHGAGVLSVLGMSQRLGKPTAMFGQGIGPLDRSWLRRMVQSTMPVLDVIGLREGLISKPLLRNAGVPVDRIHVTGDDALLIATPPERPTTGTDIGLNVRVASYSQMATAGGNQVITTVQEVARDHGLSIIALPVECNKSVSDLEALRAAGGAGETSIELSDISSPEELVSRVSFCRIVVTGSYHAAVFALASGIPAVCVTNSAYYDGKFAGLSAQFPRGCIVVRPGPSFSLELRTAIERSLLVTELVRDEIHSAAVIQVRRGDQAYCRFEEVVSERACTPTRFDQSTRSAKP